MMSIQTDVVFGKLFRSLDSTVRMYAAGNRAENRASPLTEKYGEGKWLLTQSENTLYFNLDLGGPVPGGNLRGIGPAEQV
jgi:hypothetical protein